MKIIESKLKGAFSAKRPRFDDERGTFMPTLNPGEANLSPFDKNWIMNNVSHSKQGVLRGMHYQSPSSQAKLITLISGAIQDVIIDLREDSETYMQWDSFDLSENGLNQVLIPKGFAHGFLVTGDHALITYLADAPYQPEHEHIIAWDDPRFNIGWKATPQIISSRDRDTI